LRAGKNDEAIVRACAVAVIRPDDLIVKELLFDGYFQKRDWLPALALAEELVRLQPDVPRLHDAALLYRRPDGEIRPRPAHARPHAVAAHPQSLPGAPGVTAVALPDPQSRFGARHQNAAAVLKEVEELGIPRLL
jgi:hypothetical protein